MTSISHSRLHWSGGFFLAWKRYLIKRSADSSLYGLILELGSGDRPIFSEYGSVKLDPTSPRGDSAIRAIGEHLPFFDNDFSLACGIDVLHHINDRPAFISELHRVLEPGGKAIFVEPSPLNPINYLLFRNDPIESRLFQLNKRIVMNEWQRGWFWKLTNHAHYRVLVAERMK